MLLFAVLDRHYDAQVLEEEALAFRLRVLPSDHAEVGESMNNLAHSYFRYPTPRPLLPGIVRRLRTGLFVGYELLTAPNWNSHNLRELKRRYW